MNHKILSFSALFLTLAAAVSSQTPKPVEVPMEQCNDEFAKYLVDQQVTESRIVTETAKRVRILTRSADFLWKLDQPTARTYFADAFGVATAHFSEKGFEKQSEKGLVIHVPDYRFEVIREIAPRDAEWAKKLTEQLLKDYDKSAADRNELDRKRELESIMEIAQESVKTNPDLAWYLFRRLMKHRLDVYWYFALYSIAGKDRRFADTLYGELLSAYLNETPRRLLFLSAFPFGHPRVFGFDKFSYGTAVPAGFEPNTLQQQRFIEVYLRRVAAFVADPENLNKPPEGNYRPEALYMYTALQDMEPLIIERFPQLIQRFSEARAYAQSALNEEMRKSLSEQERHNEQLSLTFDKRLELVEKADEEGKLTDFMIVRLVTWGEVSKTEEQFRKIEPWLGKIKDEDVRNGTTSYFWFLRTKLAVKENRFDDARSFAGKVPELEHRAILLFDIAEAQIKDLNEASAVYTTLNDVGRAARRADNSIAKARIHLGLANLYEKINHTFALDELSDAVKVINRLENPDILSRAVMRRVSGKDFSFFAVFEIPGYDMESTFKVMSKDDFDMTLSNARTLDDKYLRTLAVMAIARNCIDKPKPKAKPAAKAAGPR